MMIKKTFLVSVLLLFGYAFFTKAAEDADTGDKELITKIMSVGFKCFKDADWNACGEMLKIDYDITQQKYKQCTCQMACIGEELGMIDSDGKPTPEKLLEQINRVKHEEIKSQLQNVYEKCKTVTGAEKCDLAEKFTVCALKESPILKEHMSTLIETIKKMKGN